MKKLLIMTICLFTASCSLSPIKGQRTGESRDLLQNNEKITVSSTNDKSIMVKVITKSGQACTGKFEFTDSSTGIPLITVPFNSYSGKFSPNSTACKEALGENSVTETLLRHTASISILGMDDDIISICKELDGFICIPMNTFKLD